MRNRIILGTALLMLSLSFASFAETKVLIDFDLLKANGDGSTGDDKKGNDFASVSTHDKKQHIPTLVDYSAIAGSNFSQADIKKMATSLAIDNWVVQLNSSASTVENKGFSYTKEWHTKYVGVLRNELAEDATVTAGAAATDKDFEKKDDTGFTVMGVRIHFPETAFNNWALIKPPFEIPAYEDITTDYKGALLADADKAKEKGKGNKFLNGYGVVRNVGILKSINLRVYGCQFKNSIAVLLKDENDVVTEYQMPQYLDFDGWRKLTWTNPNYISNAANRDLYIVPLYPKSEPFKKIYGFRVYRQGDQFGGDFVTYIKDVIITYDKAVLDRDNMPIDNEEAWGILSAKREAAKKREFSKIGQTQILRYLERQKMDGYKDETAPATTTPATK